MAAMNAEGGKHQGRLYTGAYPVVVLVTATPPRLPRSSQARSRTMESGRWSGRRRSARGLVQTIIPLSDDSAVKITTQHYFTPNKIDINKRYDSSGKQVSGGIKPDVEVT
jgi:carboxyl-terminal processing protease